jgi:aryl-alcohol dehydrogenase-like predicted oxidoreductase
MRYVEVAGVRVSAIGLGTWQFGSGEWGYGSTYADETAPKIVQRSLDLGVTLFDTAEIYGFGRSERILGRALGDRRAEAFLATKLFPVMPTGRVVESRARGSARRLGVDAVDLYQVHWRNPLFPIRPTMAALQSLREDGIIRHVGVSNFSRRYWEEAETALGAPVLSNQVKYSLIDRAPEIDILPWAQENGRLVIAYSPLAQGLLSGRYDVGHLPTGMRAGTPAFLEENVRRLAPVLDVLRDVAGSHGATCSQVALAWLIRRPNVVVIPGASSVAQAESNAAAADIELSDAEDAALTEASDAFDPIRGTAAVGPLARERVGRLAGRIRRTMDGLGH